MENIVLYGGSFDPVHNGHLRLARAASLRLNANVIFVPSKSLPSKTLCAPAEHRLAMLRLAVKNELSTGYSVSTFELRSREEKTYWVDTLKFFKAKYPKAKLYFLLGADQVNQFPHWKDPDVCCSLATPLYCVRDGVKLDDNVLKRYRMQRLPYDKAGPVSSSAIRSLQSMDVPMCVRDYIEKNQLYYFQKIATRVSSKRLVHCVSVARLSYEIAIRNRLPRPETAYIAGLLHDIGKAIPKSEAIPMMQEYFPDYVDFPAWTFHQFLGVVLAKQEFHITDGSILDAICYHATGKAHMNTLGKIIYSADKTDPLRGYDSSKLISACVKNAHLGFIEVLRENRIYLLNKGWDVDNRLTKECMKLYLGVK